MKKLLLGSTALVVGGLMAAPAMAADPIKVGVGGYYTFYAVAGGIDSSYATNGTSTAYKGLFFQQEGEIHFIGQTKLDNGTSGLSRHFTIDLAWKISQFRKARLHAADCSSVGFDDEGSRWFVSSDCDCGIAALRQARHGGTPDANT